MRNQRLLPGIKVHLPDGARIGTLYVSRFIRHVNSVSDTGGDAGRHGEALATILGDYVFSARGRINLHYLVDQARGVSQIGNVQQTVDDRDGIRSVQSRHEQDLVGTVSTVRIHLDDGARVRQRVAGRVELAQVGDIQRAVRAFGDVRGQREKPAGGDRSEDV